MSRRLWIGGKVTAPMYVLNPVPHRPDLVMWLESPTGLPLSTNVVQAPSPASAVADCLVRAMQGRPRRPDRIRVADRELAHAVRAVLKEPIPIEIGPTPELEFLAREMGRDTGPGVPASYLEHGNVDQGLVSQLFEVADRLHRLAPWESAADTQVLGLDVPELGISSACVSIIGAMKSNFGLAIFESLDAFWAFADAGNALSEGSGTEIDLGGRVLSLNFERKSDIPSTMLREIARHGWRVAGPRAYPRLLLADRDGIHAPLSDRDVRLVIAAAEALVRLLLERPGLFTTRVAAPITREYHVDPPSAVTVCIAAPHPEDSWLEEDEPGWDDGPTVDPGEIEKSRDEGDAEWEQALCMVAGFLDSQHSRRAADDGPPCEIFLRYKLFRCDGRLDHFTAGHALDFLLDYFPQKVTADEALIRRTPEVLSRFYDWLGSTGRIPAASAAKAGTEISAARGEFFEAAHDPSRFGMAKSIMTMMHERGVDTTDPVEVDRFIDEYNETLSARRGGGSRTAISDVTATAPPVDELIRAARRWRPAPGQLPPGTNSPCPCGSRRKYKRCCMPR